MSDHDRVELCIAPDHPAMAGHFPGNPVVPGALWLEAVQREAQTRWNLPAGASDWQRVRFLRPVAPGVPASLYLSGDGRAFRFRIETGDGELVASGSFRHEPLD